MLEVRALVLFVALQCSAPALGSDLPGSGTVSSGQFDLEYRVEGSGPPAIVIGFPNYYPRVFAQELRSHLQFVFVDHRGTAPSPGSVPDSEFSLEKLTGDIELIRESLDLGEVVIIGHSGHALIALEYAKRYPNSVSHVVMIGIAPNFGPENTALRDEHWEKTASAERKNALERNWAGHDRAAEVDTYPGESFIRSYVRNGPIAWYDHDFDSTPLWEGVEVNMDMYNHVWGTLLSELDVTVGLEDLDVPVFLALGAYDYLVAPPSSWDAIAPRFHDLTIRIYHRSGHTPQLEEAAEFNADLVAWIRGSADEEKSEDDRQAILRLRENYMKSQDSSDAAGLG